MRSNKAVKAFYGTRDSSRPQEIFTPLALVQPLLEVWGEIALDPCSHPDSPVPALKRWFGDADAWDANGVPTAWAGLGLIQSWADRTYVNPPFSELKRWIAHARTCEGRFAFLTPARFQRPWLRRFVLDNTAVALNSVKFEGYDQCFPQALLVVTNDPAVAIAYQRAGLGDVLC